MRIIACAKPQLSLGHIGPGQLHTCDADAASQPANADRFPLADTDISSYQASIRKTVSLIPTPFEERTAARGYDITPAVLPDSRVYADRRTQEAYEAWQAGAATVHRMLKA